MPNDPRDPDPGAGIGDDPGHRTEAGTRALLAAFTVGDPDEQLRLDDLLAGLGKRVFGMLLFIAAIPAFIPVPGLAGAISGPLTVIVGAQLLIGMRRPWLPRFLARRGPYRHTLVGFERRISPLLARIERRIRPRMSQVLDHRVAAMFTGLLVVLLGVLLALPIPFTNYLFGLLMLAYALALLERDGALMLLCWVAGIIAVGVFGVASGALAAAAAHWISVLL
ncbi:MAG: exopolysaccharide biosynthesis protein [Luteimonas sp.]